MQSMATMSPVLYNRMRAIVAALVVSVMKATSTRFSYLR